MNTASKQIILAPLRVIGFVLRRPTSLVLFLFLLVVTLAHFSPKVADHFNRAVTLFGLSTVTSETTEVIRNLNSKLNNESLAHQKTRRALDKEVEAHQRTRAKGKAVIEKLGADVKLIIQDQGERSKEIIEQLDARMSRTIATKNVELSDLKILIRKDEASRAKLKTAASKLKRSAVTRLNKVAIYDSTGELLGWLPVVGDVASIGLAAAGIYEMCEMYREIEMATTEFGVPFTVYSGTFCEQSINRSAEVAGDTMDYVVDVKEKIRIPIVGAWSQAKLYIQSRL